MAVDDPSTARHVGKYVLERELGRGGMGAVYLALDPETGQRVAMKELLITTAADPISVQRFLQEGEVMSRMSHPNIVGVEAIIEGDQGHYIALEFIKGGSLRDLLKGGPLPTPQAFAVMHSLLQALDYAHQHAIVHRDVKPENVMLAESGAVKVADFGIARLTDDSQTNTATKTGTTVGTPQYMSPEQVTTSKVDGRSDLYSAGIVCYEVFCGRPPFEASETDGPFTLFAKHVQAPPPPPTVIRPGLDAELEKVILKSLAKRPEDRFQSGAEFDNALTRIANRLCGPNWVRAMEPGADLNAMKPEPTATTVMPALVPGVPSGMSAMPANATMPSGAPVYQPQPPAPRPAAKGPKPLLIGAIVGAVVIVIGIIAGIALAMGSTNSKPNGGPTSPPTATPTNPAAGPCTFLRSGMPTSGATGVCGVKLGASVLTVSLAGASALPADLKAESVDAAVTPTGAAVVPVSGGFAALTAKSQGTGVDVRTAAPPSSADIVAVADFTPTSSTDANIGLALRCTATDCVYVYLSPSGKVWIMERAAKSLNQLFTDAAALQVNSTNRLTVLVKGSQVQAWINGSLIASVQTSVTGAGSAAFFDIDQSASQPSTVNLSNLYLLQPA